MEEMVLVLRRPLPPDRSLAQVQNHYLVEKSIAERLKRSNREERTQILTTMYDELFSRVPDHPRLTRRESKQLTSEANNSKLSLLARFLNVSDLFIEFAPGDCRFAFEVADRVKHVYGVDISDQRNPTDRTPANFQLIVYDGYRLDSIPSNSIDLVFSDQLIEHFHPEDTKAHFELVHRILKRGGKYVFRTPHALTGPHDVSQYFSYEAEGFHLKEWTYAEIKTLLLGAGYSEFHAYWNARGTSLRVPYGLFALCEFLGRHVPKPYARVAARYLIPSLSGVAVK